MILSNCSQKTIIQSFHFKAAFTVREVVETFVLRHLDHPLYEKTGGLFIYPFPHLNEVLLA